MKEQLEELRVEIDGLSQLTINLRPENVEEGRTSFELYETNKSLLLAKAWIGKLLGELGVTSPYKNDGKRKSVEDIEPTDAKASIDLEETSNIKFGDNPIIDWKEINYIQKVDTLRQSVQRIIDKVKVIDKPKEEGASNFLVMGREGAVCRTQIWVHLVEARLHLGFELGRTRDVSLV